MDEKTKKFLIALFLVVGISIIAGTYVFLNKGKPKEGPSSQEMAEKAINYINQNLLTEGNSASLIDVIEESGLYKIRIKIGEDEYDSYVTKDGKLLFPQAGINLDETIESEPEVSEEETYTIGNFSVAKEDICKEDGKPIVYFFGSKSCPHCNWEHPVVEDVVEDFEGYISFHNNMDSNADGEIFSKYSTGGIPAVVLGCKYYRVGSGERLGEEEESKALTALICKLTDNQPSDVCNLYQDLIDQINE